MSLRRAADIVRADRRECTLAELQRLDVLASARKGKVNGAGSDMHQVELAEANQRAALAEREAALWRATAEVLRLERDVRRDQARRGSARQDGRTIEGKGPGGLGGPGNEAVEGSTEVWS